MESMAYFFPLRVFSGADVARRFIAVLIVWYGVCSVVASSYGASFASLLGKASRATASERRPFGEAVFFLFSPEYF